MYTHFFSEEDQIEALRISGTGMWKLEAGEGIHTRFYGDSYMNELIGGPEDMTPEERYDYFMEHVSKEDLKLFMEYYYALKDTAKAEVVYRYNHETLGVIYVRCGGQKSYVDGNVIGYRGFHQNVTNTIRVEQETRKRLTQQSELFRTVAYKMMQGFSDATARINLGNGEFEWYTFDGDTVYEHPQYEDMFKMMGENVPEEYRAEYLANASLENIKEQISKNDSYNFSTFIYRPEDGGLRRVTYWYFAVDEANQYVLSVFKDTTDEYEKERQLADALLVAKQANRAKTIFLNNMSHDIRTPMNAIIGFTDLAEKNLSDEAKCRDYLEKIKTSSRHLLSLINDVLDMSRIESGRMVLREESANIAEIMDNLSTILQADADNKELDFSVDYSQITGVPIMCDKLRLNQVLLNCASNAIKFTNPGGKIRIAAKQMNDAHTCAEKIEYRFVVEDTGIGMSEDYISKIFDPFSREENTVHTIEGTGLGMTICKTIVDMMGGEIKVESKIGVGTRFEINIAFRRSEEGYTSSIDDTADISILKGKKILLVEDNELNREIACELLKETEAVVEIATNGQEALEYISTSPIGEVDLVLMDIQMPVLNGYEATKAIRNLDRTDAKTLKILAMTANAFEEDKQLALQAGMNGHLAKPIDVNELFKLMVKMMN